MSEYFGNNPCEDYDDYPDAEELCDCAFACEFEDGSIIKLIHFDEPVVTVPSRKIKKLWMAEEVANHIELHELDNVQAEQYITKNYKTI